MSDQATVRNGAHKAQALARQIADQCGDGSAGSSPAGVGRLGATGFTRDGDSDSGGA